MTKYLISLCLLVVSGCIGCFGQGRISRPSKPHHSTTQNRPEEVVADELEFVDLGLPSKTLWANKNVGANKISDNGSNETWANVIRLSDGSGMIFVSGRIPSKDEYNELRKICKYASSG